MAITVRYDPVISENTGRRIVTGELTFDAAYVAGGEPWDLSTYFDRISGALFESQDGYIFTLEAKATPVSAKVKVWEGDNNNAADGPLIELAGTPDLTGTAKVGFIVFGAKS